MEKIKMSSGQQFTTTIVGAMVLGFVFGSAGVHPLACCAVGFGWSLAVTMFVGLKKS